MKTDLNRFIPLNEDLEDEIDTKTLQEAAVQRCESEKHSDYRTVKVLMVIKACGTGINGGFVDMAEIEDWEHVKVE